MYHVVYSLSLNKDTCIKKFTCLSPNRLCHDSCMQSDISKWSIQSKSLKRLNSSHRSLSGTLCSSKKRFFEKSVFALREPISSTNNVFSALKGLFLTLTYLELWITTVYKNGWHELPDTAQVFIYYHLLFVTYHKQLVCSLLS